MKRLPVFAFALAALGYFSAHPAWADSTSTNFALVEDRFTGGSGNATSTNYQAVESSISHFGAASMTSANYALETKIGISIAAGISVISSVSPGDFSKLYSDQNAAFTVTAISPDSDSLQYTAKQGSTTKAGPQSSNALSWTLTTADQGRYTIGIEVSDQQGTTLKTQNAYVVRRPTK